MNKIPKIWMISGEMSGDIYGAAAARELRRLHPEMLIKGMGGACMREAGVDIQVDSTELGVVGLVEVLKKLIFFLKLLNTLSQRIIEDKPDGVVLIDYPGFNLRLAKRLHRAGIPVIYYISPQVWAWKKGRIGTIAQNVDRLLCIFPFEPEVYAGVPLSVSFVGHPLLEILAPLKARNVERDDHVVLLLPGSRTGELTTLVKPFVETALQLKKKQPDLRFVMPLTSDRKREVAQRILDEMQLPQEFLDSLEVTVGHSREWMCRATAGLAASGTVTVEAAILGLPLVVAYKVNWLTYQAAKRLVKLPSITIANLVTNRMVYQECLQYDAVPEKLLPALEAVLPGGSRREEVLQGIEDCVQRLGGQRQVSRQVAMEIMEVAQGQK